MRFSQQEQLILSLKSKLFEYEHSKDTRNPHNSHQYNHHQQQQYEMEALLDEKSDELQLLHQQLTKRDAIIEKQKVELDSMSNDIVNRKRSEVSNYILYDIQIPLIKFLKKIDILNMRDVENINFLFQVDFIVISLEFPEISEFIPTHLWKSLFCSIY